MTNAEATEYLELEIGYLLETNGGTCKEIEADKIALFALREQAERKHGEWINRPKTCVFVCSVCGREVRTFHTNRAEESEREFPYCHCGAKMDKRRESEVSE